MRYQIIQNSDPDRLVAFVNAAITEGWEPLGGVSSGPVGHGYIQAMVRKEPMVL